MKNLTKKFMLLLLSTLFLITASSGSAVLAADKTMSVTIRIEGTEKNLFYETQDIPYTDTLTLQKALSYIDTQEKDLTITGVDAAYITDINGDTAGKFGGWDGWLYTVNGEAASVGIDSLKLNDGDNIVLYYGDPFGVGMQYPVADTSDIKEGKIRFTSSDTTYDADYKATVAVNPVVGATVTWSNGVKSTDYITDKEGVIILDKADLTSGAHAVQISKIGDAGIPLVLRYAPDYTIFINEDSTTAQNTTTLEDNAAVQTVKTDNTVNTVNTDNAADTNASVNKLPKTGENSRALFTFFLAAGSLMGLIIVKNKAGKYEK